MRFLKLFIDKFRDVDGIELDIEIALHEALANAVIHGNREDPHKPVHVTCRCSMDGQISITVRDEGHGFELMHYPTV
jgi:serine/threonine-protein kinase RsbW